MKLVKGWMLAGVMLAAATAQAGSHGMSVDAMLEKASAANSKAKAMGYEWTITAPAIKKAQAAKEAGKADEAKGLASKALYWAEASVFQAENEDQNWKMRVPR
ncbi:hypothetical protein GH975_09705 [Litorivicinus lipolyticus]|uniref:SoxXA-binding protein SoxK n=1 Tax=Litorivicinus lipolyticus TaxID=418701 RepID=A0A5Q2Q877_9GAMM|nr:hypothetical protein [Litorivicinus lipolyticus]QGG80829.1 hypothetical protein GH975_09705 [Litorivicinus lipolyticus]